MKYRRKPEIIEAEVYCEGMENGWILHFSGNAFNYERTFKTLQHAKKFIELNLGFSLLDEMDKAYENDIIYESPMPYIKTYNGNHEISDGDYILTHPDGTKSVKSAKEFHGEYEPIVREEST